MSITVFFFLQHFFSEMKILKFNLDLIVIQWFAEGKYDVGIRKYYNLIRISGEPI